MGGKRGRIHVTWVDRRLLVGVSLLLVLALVSVLSVASSTAVEPVEVDDGLVLWYALDEQYSSGSAVRDSSARGNDGRYVGAPPNATEASADGLQFSPDSGYVTVTVPEKHLVDDFTITVRVKNPRQDHHAGIVASDSWRLTAPYDTYQFRAGNRKIRHEEAATDTWHHLAVVYRDGNLRLLVDGETVGSNPVSGDLSTSRVFIGRRVEGYEYDGRIADVRIYDRALSDAEVRGIAAGEARFRPVLYSDGFRVASTLTTALVAIVLAFLEVRGLSRPS